MNTTDIRSHIAVPFGHSRDFEIDGRTVTVTRTEGELYLIGEGDDVAIIHPQPDGSYVVTGPTRGDAPSEAVDYARAIDICLTRLCG